jgi:hypothetical protein
MFMLIGGEFHGFALPQKYKKIIPAKFKSNIVSTCFKIKKDAVVKATFVEYLEVQNFTPNVKVMLCVCISVVAPSTVALLKL